METQDLYAVLSAREAARKQGNSTGSNESLIQDQEARTPAPQYSPEEGPEGVAGAGGQGGGGGGGM